MAEGSLISLISSNWNILSLLVSCSTTDTPQHNGFAERANRTIFDPVRCMLEESGLPASYWSYAAHQVAYIKSRLPHSRTQKVPHEVVFGNKPSLKHVRVFGCAAFVYKKRTKSKVHGRAEPGILLGNDDNGVYTVELINSRKIVRSVNVTFDEENFPALDNSDYVSDSNSDSESWVETSDYDSSSDSDEVFGTSECESSESTDSPQQSAGMFFPVSSSDSSGSIFDESDDGFFA